MKGLVFRLTFYLLAGAFVVYAVVGLTTSRAWYDAPFMRGKGPHYNLDKATTELVHVAAQYGSSNVGNWSSVNDATRELRSTYLRQAAVAGAVFVLGVVAPVEILIEARRWRRRRDAARNRPTVRA